MTNLAVPAGAPDPQEDPQGFLIILLRMYVVTGVKGLVTSTIRMWVPLIVGGVATWIAAHWNIVVPEDATSTAVIVATGAVTGVYYLVARALEQRFPRLGRILLALGLTGAKPVYAAPAVAQAVEAKPRT